MKYQVKTIDISGKEAIKLFDKKKEAEKYYYEVHNNNPITNIIFSRNNKIIQWYG